AAFDAAGLRPGTYRLGLEVKVGAGDALGQLVAPGAVALGAGADSTQEFHLRRAVLAVQIVDATGKPVTGRHFVVRRAEVGFTTGAQTDERGALRIEPIAAGHYEICDRRPGAGGAPPAERWG